MTARPSPCCGEPAAAESGACGGLRDPRDPRDGGCGSVEGASERTAVSVSLRHFPRGPPAGER